jgi:hypothetical protein
MAQVTTTSEAILESEYDIDVECGLDAHINLSYAVMSGIGDTTPYHSPAQSGSTTYTLGQGNGIEGAIFRLDDENNEILPTWINTDGSSHLSFFGMPGSSVVHPLVISQNIGSYNAINGGYSARMFCRGTD